jgi:hypothetical protein
MKEIKLIIPQKKSIQLSELPVWKEMPYELEIFDARTIAFANSLSIRILRDKTLGREVPFVALAYWLRKSNLQRIAEQNNHLIQQPNIKAVPLGTVFHVCPSNVDTMFVYSLVLSLLMGNRNVLRLSSKTEDDQIDYLFGLINAEIQESAPFLEDYINVVSYERDDEINRFISGKVNARVLWGGDETARTFKKINENVRSRDIVFSDRISMTLIGADAFIALDEKEKQTLARSFFNDAYTFDQKGCSSPQKVLFMGSAEACDTCMHSFFSMVDQVAAGEYRQDIFSLASMKYNQLVTDIIEQKVKKYTPFSNRLYAVSGPGNNDSVHSCGGGYFEVRTITDVSEIGKMVDTRYQTLSYFGVNAEQINTIASETVGKGVDRIVPVGRALEFNYIWDGYNLITELCSVKNVF